MQAKSCWAFVMAVPGGGCKQPQHPCKGNIVSGLISSRVTGLHCFLAMCLSPFPIALTLSMWLVKYVGVQQVSQMIMNLLFFYD